MLNNDHTITPPLKPENQPVAQSTRGKINSVWNWLTRPLTALPTAIDRRKNLLAWLLISLFILTIAALILVLLVDPVSNPRHWEYIHLILALDLLLVFAYALNCAGYYTAAAGLTIACAFLGPWGSLITDPNIIHGDLVPLAYTTLVIFLASFLLSPLFTAVLSIVQLIGLVLIPILKPACDSLNWPSLLALIFFASVLSILASILNQRNLEEIGRQAIQSSQSEARMRELSVRDYLTNLFNRRYLEETLKREISRSSRSNYTIGVIMFDVDCFKELNDERGHAAGDVVLQQLGQLCMSMIRGGDIACRYGGDEFVLVLPEASLEVTEERAEHIRIEARKIQEHDRSRWVNSFTLSFGVAIYPDHGSTEEELINSADKALYQAKSDGRDRVVVAEKDR